MHITRGPTVLQAISGTPNYIITNRGHVPCSCMSTERCEWQSTDAQFQGDFSKSDPMTNVFQLPFLSIIKVDLSAWLPAQALCVMLSFSSFAKAQLSPIIQKTNQWLTSFVTTKSQVTMMKKLIMLTLKAAYTHKNLTSGGKYLCTGLPTTIIIIRKQNNHCGHFFNSKYFCCSHCQKLNPQVSNIVLV